MTPQKTVLLALLLCLSGTASNAATIYVDQGAPNVFPDGSSWPRAYVNLQDGMAAAHFGDEIRVAQGTYEPDQGFGIVPGDRMASFILISGIRVLGGFAGYGSADPDARDVEGNPTFLSGDLNGDDLGGGVNIGDNAFHVVSVFGLGWDTTLDGFTISGGASNGYRNDRFGAGLYMEAGSPTADGALNIKNCTICNNTAVFGGGVATMGGIVNFGNTQLCGNRALVYGGALYADDSMITMANILLTGNTCDNAFFSGSDAIYSVGSSLMLDSCTVAHNGPANAKAIVNTTWDANVTHTAVTNSILRNGGNEIWSSHPDFVSVQYSNVQGGSPGTGNIDSDPLFTNPGDFDSQGQWVKGDYTLQSNSPSIDAGNQILLPKDLLDLNENGNTSEPLPVDLVANDRVQNNDVDQGAYEYEDSGTEPPDPPDPGDGWVLIATMSVLYDAPTNPPTFPITVTGRYSSTVVTNFKAELAVVAEATSPGGGDWSETHFDPDPNPVPSGVSSINVKIIGKDFLPSALPPDSPSYTIAELKIYGRPAQGAKDVTDPEQGFYVLDEEPRHVTTASE